MNMEKKGIIGILSILLVLTLSISGTLAFLTDSEEVTNVFAVGDLDITLNEPNWDPNEGTNLQPGSTMMKDPVVKAVDNDSYMRVYVTFIDENGDAATNANYGKQITDTDRLSLIAQTIYYDSTFNATTPSGAINVANEYSLAQLAAITSINNGVNGDFTKDTTRSEAGKDCYNYTANSGKFAEGTEVILFTNIVVPTDWNQAHLETLGKYDVVIQAQAIQHTGFADAAEAFTALDGEVTAGTIQKDHGVIGGTP